MTDSKRDELLLQIWQKLGEIDIKLNADYRALHGNGSPGLVEKHNELEKRVQSIDQAQMPSNAELAAANAEIEKRLSDLEILHTQEEKRHSLIVTWIGLLITAIGTIYAIFKNN